MTAGECTSVDGCMAAAGNIQLPSSLLGTDNNQDAFSAMQSGIADSDLDGTKDVDLQRRDLQDANLNIQANSFQTQFGMDFDSARQLAQLADQFQSLQVTGQITEEQREQISHAALAVAGISVEDVNSAIAGMISGNPDAMHDLVDTAANHLHMPSSAGLSDQLLPQLGITLPN
jgi:hypothetical protein